jgi:orotidine-5'-phosphate decarboxylase
MTDSIDASNQPFNERLEQVCISRKSNLCVGLDPDCERVLALVAHPSLENSDLCISTMFTAASAAAMSCAAFKPNAAFFEALETHEPLTAKIGEYLTQLYPDILAICDAKRGDIGNTSAQYAKAVFEKQHFDAVTVNPLMGSDAVEPFLRNSAKGVFLLCLTSNPGADDFLLQNELFLRIAEKAVKWNNHGNVGLVVGATRPEYLARIREIAPDLPLLIPGVGAQGGRLDETLDAINGRQNRRFLINASRAVLYPADATWENYAEKVGAAARHLRDEINSLMAI